MPSRAGLRTRFITAAPPASGLPIKPGEWTNQKANGGCRLVPYIGCEHSRVNGVCGDPAMTPTVHRFGGEQDVGELGVSVRLQHPLPGASACDFLQAGSAKVALPMPSRAHVDDASASRLDVARQSG